MPRDSPTHQAADPVGAPEPKAPAAATKPWWRSRTIWFNVTCAGLGAAQASMGLLQPALPVNAYGALAFVLAVGNAALRVLTTQPVGR